MDKKNKLAFTRTNYVIMLAGIGALITGFLVMSLETEPHGFGPLGMTIGPIIIAIGFLVEFVAILYKAKDPEKENPERRH